MLFTKSPYIRFNNGIMNIFKIFYCFKLNDYGIFHKKVNPVPAYFHAVIHYFYFFLVFNRQAPFLQFDDNGIFINGFKKTRS